MFEGMLDRSQESETLFSLLADFILVAHFSFTAFVIFGLAITIIGGYLDKEWARNIWFRGLHLLSVIIIVVQSWLGVVCPLTTLEMWLRQKANMSTYEVGFVQHWLHQLLFYDAPAHLFIITYTLFGVLVVLTMFKYPPSN